MKGMNLNRLHDCLAFLETVGLLLHRSTAQRRDRSGTISHFHSNVPVKLMFLQPSMVMILSVYDQYILDYLFESILKVLYINC